MRVFLKVDEKRKQDLIELANYSRSIEVQGEYYKGCQLIKHIKGDKTVLEIK